MQGWQDPAMAFDLGNACLERGDPCGAIAAFERCLELAPDHPATLFNLGNAQVKAERFADGAATLTRCLRLAPGFAAAHVNLAGALFRLRLLGEARRMAEIAVRLAPDEPEALLCHATMLHHAGEHEAAVAVYHQALRHAPRHAGGLSSLGNSLRCLGRIDEALTAHDRALAVAPDDPTIRFNRALALLTAGRLDEGFREYEQRWRRPGDRPRFASPSWQGEALEGRTILLYAEQGFGDTLQFCRFAPLVSASGGRVILEVQPELVRLLRSLPGLEQIVACGGSLPPFEWHCPLMSLPRAFGATLEQVPASVPYLRADRADVARVRARLSQGGALRVGLVWAGSPHTAEFEAHLRDHRRSLPLACLAGLADLAGVQFVSLQKGVPPPDIDGLHLTDLMATAGDFADTAAIVAALDLVIAVDTAVAHLAGALGKPVWLLSRFDACWRWMHGRATSPWYPTMRIYREDRPHSWPAVITRIRHDLAAEGERLGAG